MNFPPSQGKVIGFSKFSYNLAAGAGRLAQAIDNVTLRA